MSLRAKLAAFDDTALEALASKGVVRRAQRDLDAGRAMIVEHDEAAAKVDADGRTVLIDERGPVAARCDCPAVGVCRHVVLAVMALRAAAQPASHAVIDERCAIPQADKGPKTRRRAVIAAAALQLRHRAGLAVTPAHADSSGEAPVPSEFLAAVRATIEHGVAAVLPARSMTAADAFLDLAISTRAESLPRLAAELRQLARHASLATTRNAAFDVEAFLMDASRTYALVDALGAHPLDPRLTGRVRRDYAVAEPLDLWMLGAARWRAGSGARGITAYAFSPSTGRWHAVHQGRAAGTDPGFQPANVYRSPLWSAGVLHTLIGRTLHLPEPWVAEDGAIAPTLPRPASAGPAVPAWTELIEAGAAHSDFAVLRRDLRRRIGFGLRRNAMPLPALIAPVSFGRFAFNDLDQTYEWHVTDRSGTALILELRADDEQSAERLPALARQIRAILLEAALGARGLSARPVALFVDDRPEARIVSLDFDEWPRADLVGKALERVRGVLAAHTAKVSARQPDALESVVSAVLDAAAAIVERSAHADLVRITDACESCGLMMLAGAVRRLGEANDVVSALRASYMAGEALAALRLDG